MDSSVQDAFGWSSTFCSGDGSSTQPASHSACLMLDSSATSPSPLTNLPLSLFDPSASSMPSSSAAYSAVTPPTCYARLPPAISAFPSPGPPLHPSEDPKPAMPEAAEVPVKKKKSGTSKRKPAMAANKPQTFIQKLYEALKDPSLRKLMAWDEAGKEIHIFRPSELMAAFDRTQLFKQSKWASFTRQLNIYRFRKTSSYDLSLQIGRNVATGKLVSVWEHETLNRESTDEEIATVKRRVAEGEIAATLTPSTPVPYSVDDEAPKKLGHHGLSLSLESKWKSCQKAAVPIRSSVVPPSIHFSSFVPTAKPSFLLQSSDCEDVGNCPAASTSNRGQVGLHAAGSYPAPPIVSSFGPRDVRSKPYGPRYWLFTPTRIVGSGHVKRFDLFSAVAALEESAVESLALPMLNPPPVKHPVSQQLLGFPLVSLATEEVSAWREPQQRSARLLTTPPPTLAPSSYVSIDSNYPTPIRSPPISYFRDDPSGWSTIIGDSPHPAFVHVTDDTILRAPSAAQSVCASEPSAPLPLPSGHAHPRDYLRSSVSSGRLLQLPPLPPTAPIGKLL